MKLKVKVSEINEEVLNSLGVKSLNKLRECVSQNIPRDKIKLSKVFLDNNFNKEVVVFDLYERVFEKYYNGNNVIFENWQWIRLRNGTIKDTIRRLLDEGKKVKTGYTCSKIRGVHSYIVFYK